MSPRRALCPRAFHSWWPKSWCRQVLAAALQGRNSLQLSQGHCSPWSIPPHPSPFILQHTTRYNSLMRWKEKNKVWLTSYFDHIPAPRSYHPPGWKSINNIIYRSGSVDHKLPLRQFLLRIALHCQRYWRPRMNANKKVPPQNQVEMCLGFGYTLWYGIFP